MKMDPYLTPYTKINSKSLGRKQAHTHTHTHRKKEKEKEKKITDINFCDPGIGDGLLDTTLTTRATKDKTDKLYFIEIQTLCTSRDTINKVKRQPEERENIFENHKADRTFVSRMYKEHLQLSKKKTNQFKNRQRSYRALQRHTNGQ